jgi:hypothetical protein
MILRSVITAENETPYNPAACLWPTGIYRVQQETEKDLFTPVVKVNADNRILAPNGKNNFEGRTCLNGYMGLQESLFLISRLTHLSARESSSAMTENAGDSTYGKRKGSRRNNNSDKKDELKKDKYNKKNIKTTSENDNT